MKNLTQFNKPYIISLSGLSLADNIPNKPIIAYDFEQMDLGSMNVVALQWAVIVLLIAVILFDKVDLNNHFDSIRSMNESTNELIVGRHVLIAIIN